MKINELLSVLPEYKPTSDLDTEVFLVTQNAKEVQPSSVFVAIKGTVHDGHEFIPQAIEQGATVLVVADSTQVPTNYLGVTVKVENTRKALSELAAKFSDYPSRKLFCFGVTGTNGKTTITYMLEHILTGAGVPTGVMGTINHHFQEKIWDTHVTTPEVVELQNRFYKMKQAGAKAVAVEVSSHALAQLRADSVDFDCVIFTNLTRDHLDYHNSMKAYFEAKQRLFLDLLWKTSKTPNFAVINVDDKWGRRIRVPGPTNVWTYGKKGADFQFKILKNAVDRTEYELKTPMGTERNYLSITGEHNVYNAVAAITACACVGIPARLAAQILTQFRGAPGRLQSVENQKDLNVFIDYAHTPDALKNVLESLQKIKNQGRIWTIFGCGGDRDKGKRPLMAQAAEELSDFVMVTSDNPRSENPQSVIDDIFNGFKDPKNQLQELDRRKAMEIVFSRAQKNDLILIAGKGHEDYQIIGSTKQNFDDYKVAKELLS